MKLSKLQKFILLESLGRKGIFKRNTLLKFYDKQKTPAKKEERQKIITKSLESLIDKELMIGYGRRTPHKWFIDEIKLTAKGRKKAKSLFGKQQALPLRLKKSKMQRSKSKMTVQNAK